MTLTAKITVQNKAPTRVDDFGYYRVHHKERENDKLDPTIVLLTPYGAIYFTEWDEDKTHKLSFSGREWFDKNYKITGTYEADLTLKLKEI